MTGSRRTLSGGESQRINLATSLGSSLVGAVYVLDEPSIGLHPRDNGKLIGILQRLRDVGNTVIVVEHDADMMRASDVMVDMGPKAGELGGEVVFVGSPAEIVKDMSSLTGAYLSGREEIPVPKDRRPGSGLKLTIEGAAAHNLKGITPVDPAERLRVRHRGEREREEHAGPRGAVSRRAKAAGRFGLPSGSCTRGSPGPKR